MPEMPEMQTTRVYAKRGMLREEVLGMNTVEPDRAQSRRQGRRDWTVPLLVGLAASFVTGEALLHYSPQVAWANLGAMVALLLFGCVYALIACHLIWQPRHVAMLLRIPSLAARPRQFGVSFLSMGIGIMAMALLEVGGLLSLPVPTDNPFFAFVGVLVIGGVIVLVMTLRHIN